MKFLALALLAATGVAFLGPAHAQTVEQSFAYLDLDKDGKISLNEYLNFQLPRLAQFDQNANGKLSQAEFKASLVGQAKRNAETSFRAFDRNKDRSLDQQEFLGYHAYIFKNYLDTDKDGFMSLAELAALQAAVN